jgi:hypothetical protein
MFSWDIDNSPDLKIETERFIFNIFLFCRPLVGKSLTIWGQIGFGIVLALSAYFIYINYITNPEFYKSIKLSREASKRDVHPQPAE